MSEVLLACILLVLLAMFSLSLVKGVVAGVWLVLAAPFRLAKWLAAPKKER